MIDGLPQWDIEPQLAHQEFLPIPQDANESWCAMANYLYRARNYRTQVLTDHYTASQTLPTGEVIIGKFNLVEIDDSSGDPECHSLVGVLIGFEMRPDFRPGVVEDAFMKVPFARLSHAEDLDESAPLSVSEGHRVLVPLTHMHELVLEISQ